MLMNVSFMTVQLRETVAQVMEHVVTHLETGPVFVRQATRQATIATAIFHVMVSSFFFFFFFLLLLPV